MSEHERASASISEHAAAPTDGEERQLADELMAHFGGPSGTVAQVAAYMGVSTYSVRRWAAAGQIPATQPRGGRYVFSARLIAGWLRRGGRCE